MKIIFLNQEQRLFMHFVSQHGSAWHVHSPEFIHFVSPDVCIIVRLCVVFMKNLKTDMFY